MTKRKILLISVLPAITISIVILLWTKDSPTLISAVYDGGVNSFTIHLKENGEYEMNNNSWLTTRSFYGQYTLSDNVIILDKTNIDDVILTNRLKICICPYYTNSSIIDSQEKLPDVIPKCLIQIDDNGQDINTHFGFIIMSDSRK